MVQFYYECRIMQYHFMMSFRLSWVVTDRRRRRVRWGGAPTLLPLPLEEVEEEEEPMPEVKEVCDSGQALDREHVETELGKMQDDVSVVRCVCRL